MDLVITSDTPYHLITVSANSLKIRYGVTHWAIRALTRLREVDDIIICLVKYDATSSCTPHAQGINLYLLRMCLYNPIKLVYRYY